MENFEYNEIWMQVDSYCNYYVSNFGRIKNINTERILKQSNNSKGYKFVVLNGDNYRVHRLVAFAFLDTPLDEKLTIDHIDRDVTNNHVNNLRWATLSQQNQNKGKCGRCCDSQFKGVSKTRKKWRARIKIDGKDINLGSFVYEIDAARAYDKKAKEIYGNCAFLNFPNDC